MSIGGRADEHGARMRGNEQGWGPLMSIGGRSERG